MRALLSNPLKAIHCSSGEIWLSPTPQLRRCSTSLESHHSHLTPNHLTTILTTTKNPAQATQLHALLITSNYIPLPLLHTQLINLYAKCGLTAQALLAFHSTRRHSNIVTWTSLIAHLSHSRRPLHALSLFSELRRAGLEPNPFTFSAVLPACAASGAAVHGTQVHALACKLGHAPDVFVASALCDMYAKCASMSGSKKVFDEMPVRNLVSWNSIVVGLTQNKMYGEAIRVFQELLREPSVRPDQVSFSSVCSACANIGGLDFGRCVHAHANKLGLESVAYVRNSLIDMYSKCGSFDEVCELFDCAEDRDVVTWNVMMMRWVQDDRFEEACGCFRDMRRDSVLADEASFSTVLNAAAGLGTWSQGAAIHDQIVKTGFLNNRCVGSSLITMYAKCGSLDDAYHAFQETRDHLNVVAWTAMIAAFQQHGYGVRVIELFEEMLEEGMEPDYITFVCVLSACSHNGLLDQGFRYFNAMSEVHGMAPGYEHYACMVDMLGRAGRLDEAKVFVNTMPIEPDASVWGALLAACRNCGNLETGEEVAHRLFEIEPDNPGNYVLLANMYVSHGRLDEAKEVRRLMGSNGVRKETSCSWIDIKNKTFVFTVHDRSHHRTEEIYAMLSKIEALVKQKGYVADTRFAVNDVGEYKEQRLWYHSERLALAFGLISLPAGALINIKKNIRTCGDCHAVMKLVSEIFQCEIILRDTNRFHRFTGGSCSCGDYW